MWAESRGLGREHVGDDQPQTPQQTAATAKEVAERKSKLELLRWRHESNEADHWLDGQFTVICTLSSCPIHKPSSQIRPSLCYVMHVPADLIVTVESKFNWVCILQSSMTACQRGED